MVSKILSHCACQKSPEAPQNLCKCLKGTKKKEKQKKLIWITKNELFCSSERVSLIGNANTFNRILIRCVSHSAYWQAIIYPREERMRYIMRDSHHVSELQTAAKPIRTVPMTKRTLRKLERSVGGVWFFPASPTGAAVPAHIQKRYCSKLR